MNLEDTTLNKISQSQKDKAVCSMVSEVVKCPETEQMIAARN